MTAMILAVCGRGDSCSPQAFQLAEEVGREIALHGCKLICGGGNGVMEGACKGAKAAGGTTIGVLPGEDPRLANPHVDIPICTGMGYARNVIVVRSAAAVIAIDGAYGTLSEVALALGYAIPVVGLRTWRVIHPAGHSDPLMLTAATPREAVELALSTVKSLAGERT